MRVFLDKSNRWVDLDGKPLGQGGQGEVYVAPHDQRLVVKIWNDQHRTGDMAERVRALSRWRNRDPYLGLPIELALDGPNGKVIGFVMPRFQGVLLLSTFNPAAAKLQGVAFRPIDRIAIAGLLAKRFGAIHKGKLLAPDGNEANFLVEEQKSGWEVYGIDCDSFEFEARDSKGQFRKFLTEVGKEEYLAPELQGQGIASTKHTVATDLFSLAVLIWLLLKGGAHPFSIRASGSVRIPPLGDLIKEGCWPYAPVKAIPPEWNPVDAGIPWAVLPKDIRELFISAFRDGHAESLKRPHASEWEDALSAWARREQDLASIAHRILRAFQALSAVRAATWLFQKVKHIPSLFGWRKDPQPHQSTPHKKLVRIALIILVIALAVYSAVKERGNEKESLTAHPILPEWGENPREPDSESDRWRGAPKQWKELLRECERSGK